MTNRDNDPNFARESFTWRRMKSWQVVTIAAAVVVLLALYFGMS